MSPNRWFTSASYITGAHAMKVGYQGVFHWNTSSPSTNDHNLQYRFNNGVPNQLTQNLFPYQDRRAHPLPRLVRARPVDPRKADVTGGAALRPCLELLSRAADRPDPLPAGRIVLSRDAGRARLQRHQPADGSGVRPVRQREDGPQVQRRPVSRGGGQRQRELLRAQAGHARDDERDADLGRRQPQFHPGLRSDERRGAGSAAERRRLLWGLVECELREGGLQPLLRRGDPQGLVQPAGRLADRGDHAARNPAARLGGGRLYPPLAPELHGHRQPRHGGVRFHAVQPHGADRFAAAGRRRLCGLRSLQRDSRQVRRRPTTSAPIRPPTAMSRWSTTAWMSTSARGCGTACRCKVGRAPGNR